MIARRIFFWDAPITGAMLGAVVLAIAELQRALDPVLLEHTAFDELEAPENP